MKKYKIIIALVIFSLFGGNFTLAQNLIPNDPLYGQQWYLSELNMPAVWLQETGKSHVVIAFIDSGVDIEHPDLKNNIWVNRNEILGDGIDNDFNGYIDDIHGWDFIDNTNDVAPQYEANCLDRKTCLEEAIIHGTFVAGIAAAISNNNLGITGISWQTKIMPLRVLSENGIGNTSDVIKAINYAIDNGADIINLSFVGDVYDPDLETAIKKAYDKDLIIISAAGNVDSADQRINLDINKMYPICHQGANGENVVIGVAASNRNKELADFSNYGSSCIDIIAPGEDFWGVNVYDPDIEVLNKYYTGEFSGTSLAAPIISGLAALIKAAKPTLTNQQITDLILNNTENIDEFNPQFVGKLGRGFVSPAKVFLALAQTATQGRLIKGSKKAVYYLASDAKRYVFPDLNTYFSWYDNFDNVQTISDEDLAAIKIGGNVTMKPGVKMIKLTSLAEVYAVSRGGVLRQIDSEEMAAKLYGPDWASFVVDISDAFFVNYQIGEIINEATDFDPFIANLEVLSIDFDKSL